ncbi:MAG: hypothetical protein U0T79_13570 [Ferruginibacter sp.]
MAQDSAELVFTMDKEYELKNDGSLITIDIIIGDKGQSPDLNVKLNSKKLLTNHDKSVKDLAIDSDDNLDTKVVRITGNVADTSKDSNKIEVTVRVKGGKKDLVKKFSVTVEEEGEEVDLSFIIRFTV